MATFADAPENFTPEEEARFRRELEKELEELRLELRRALKLVEQEPVLTVDLENIFSLDNQQVMVTVK